MLRDHWESLGQKDLLILDLNQSLEQLQKDIKLKTLET